MKVPIHIPNRAHPIITDPNVCDCKKEPVLMTYKKAVIYWTHTLGDHLDEGEVLAEGEIEKQNIQIVSPTSGVLSKICIPDGETAGVETILGYIDSEV